jgi:hypothetical protein
MGLIRWFTGSRYGAMTIGLTAGTILVLMAHRPQIVTTLDNVTSYVLSYF